MSLAETGDRNAPNLQNAQSAPGAKNIKATFIVNAAVLIEYRGVKLLIDGIYDRIGHPFSNLTDLQIKKLMAGEDEFENIEYLLFTHEHGDHFSPRLVSKYLDRQRPRAIFMPESKRSAADGSTLGSDACGRSQALSDMIRKAESLGVSCAVITRELAEHTIFRPEPEKNISIRALYTKHLDKLYEDVPHLSYLLTLGEKRLFFTGDADFVHGDFSGMQGTKLDAVFINPLMNMSKEGKRLFESGVLDAKLKAVYHIPGERDDAMGMRRLAVNEQRLAETRGDNGVHFFLESGDSISI